MISVTGSSGGRELKLVWEKGKTGTADFAVPVFALLISLQRILNPFNMLKIGTFK